jgi:cytochrome c peroxidase
VELKANPLCQLMLEYAPLPSRRSNRPLQARTFFSVTAQMLMASLALSAASAAVPSVTTPLGLPPIAAPLSREGPALAALGEQLFSDKRLSANGSVSCATCHIPQQLFTDGRPVALGLSGRALTRRTPSLLNIRYASSLFWDGRVAELAAQVRAPLLGPTEHGLLDQETVARLIRGDARYAQSFERVLGVEKAKLSILDLGAALAAYEKTLLSGDSAFDRFLYGQDAHAMTPAAVRGLKLFRGRAQCASCHQIGESSALLTDEKFHPSPLPLADQTLSQLGTLAETVVAVRSRGDTDTLNAMVASDQSVAALGHFVVTLNPADIGCFKTPSLRNVALLAPYMHDGSVLTLARAIELELYSRSVQNYPLVLTEDERADLLEFLQALTSH